jgi:hypothetical protein
MPEPMDAQSFTGPHPTCREFAAQLAAWGFKRRRDEGVHTVYRGPHGGTLRVIRSELGRADPAQVNKAARLAGVTTAQFWAGPDSHPAAAPPQSTTQAGRPGRRKRPAHDSVISHVLAIHAEADRPLGFDQVAELSGNRVTRGQVATASATLCRDGQLDRIRPGVYQWSAGQRATARRIPPPRRGQTPPQAPTPPEPAAAPPASPAHGMSELFSQLFPAGVQLTGDNLTDLAHWLLLTSKLATSTGGAQ